MFIYAELYTLVILLIVLVLIVALAKPKIISIVCEFAKFGSKMQKQNSVLRLLANRARKSESIYSSINLIRLGLGERGEGDYPESVRAFLFFFTKSKSRGDIRLDASSTDLNYSEKLSIKPPPPF